MNDIIKIYNLKNESLIENITVFYGKSDVDLNELFKKDVENEIFKNVFSSNELDKIKSDDIKVIFSDFRIYSDDTIESIKKKLAKSYNNEICFEQIYLFCKQIQKFTNEEIYNHLTQNDQVVLTYNILYQFLSNINDFDLTKIEKKDVYNYDDIISLNLNEELLINVPIGHYFILSNKQYNFTINPFEYNSTSDLLKDNINNLLSTSNKDLLLNTGFIHDNIIYYCDFENVKEDNDNKISIYYPFLKEKNITTVKELKKNKLELIEENKITEGFEKNENNIQLFYDVYYNRKKDLDYIEQGIQKFNLLLYQDFEFNLPLDVIFKLLHANKNMPFIKFNPSKKQENIYRLYCNNISKNGKKIPYLSKKKIFNLMKEIKYSNKITCYIEFEHENEKNYLLLDIDNKSNITIDGEFKKTFTISQIEDIIKKNINPILKIIQDFLYSSGYNYQLFSSLYEKNIEINNIKYLAYVSIKKNIDLSNFIGCVSSIFNVIVSELKKGIIMRYKRVSNFNEYDSIESSIIELLNRANEDDDIVKIVMENFQMKQSKAETKIAELLNNLQLVQNLSKKKTLKIKNNPGFLTKIMQDQFKQNIFIEMDNINNIFYLNCIPIYIDSLIRITQEPESTSIELNDINSLCQSSQIETEETIDDIVAPSEKPISQNEAVGIVANNLVFGNEIESTNTVNVMDFMFDESDDDQESEGVEVDLDGDEVEDGIEVDLDGDEMDGDEGEDGIEVDLDGDEMEDGIEVDLDGDEMEDGIEVDLDDDDEIKLEGGMDTKRKKIVLNIKPSNTEDIIEKDVTKIPIAGTNPFFKRLVEREKNLFLQESDEKYSAYSRLCPWNKRRQPIILTDEEKNKIDEEFPGSYTNAIKYGSDPNKKYWYICPRYWDLKRNVSLTKEQVDSGKYGKVIPQNAKKIPPGANIWEFFDSKEHVDSDGNYITHHPGFLKSDSHPDGLCIPCCFKNWDKPAQEKRRKECLQSEKVETTTKKELDEYIKGPDKFPLEKDRFGYLPFIVQSFIQVDNKNCQISKTNTNLKKNVHCFLRKGVENNKQKSFIACISDIFMEINNDVDLSIKDFITQKLLPILNLDSFSTLQNGNLISMFQDNDEKLSKTSYESFNDSSIIDTKFYKDIKNEKQLKKVISAFVNFKEYLLSNATINYEYTWDLICNENKMLFPKGLNLIIMDIPSDDITSNISIICPTNYYSNNKFVSSRDTVFLIKKYDYFEPIYIVIDKSKTSSISLRTTKLFTSELMEKVPNLKNIKDNIKDIYKSMCKPLPSIKQTENMYGFKQIKFKKNYTLPNIVNILTKYNITVLKLVLNYDNKVIGLVAKNKDKEGYIPTFPSGIIENYDLISMDSEEYLQTLNETIDFLLQIKNDTNEEVLCLPVIKVLENGLVVGVLTETNQFISLVEPQTDDDNLITLKMDDDNFLNIDKKTQISNKKDKEREDFIKKINLETKLYELFRNKIKTLINQYGNKNVKSQLESISNSPILLYYDKLKKIKQILQNLLKSSVKFVVFDNNYDLFESENNNFLMIPSLNLLSNISNEKVYFNKISDELVRFKRIKQFMFEPRVFLFFSDIKYSLNEDEVIILESLLNNTYFDDLIPEEKNKFISFNSYDTSEPNKTIQYDDDFKLNVKNEVIVNQKQKTTNSFNIIASCDYSIDTISRSLNNSYSKIFKELNFSSASHLCTFDIATTLVTNTIQQNITRNEIKQKLLDIYKKLFYENEELVLRVINIYGKPKQSKQIKTMELSFENYIMDENYSLNIFDLILLSEFYNFPLVLIGNYNFRENGEKILSFNLQNNNTAYIVKPSLPRKYDEKYIQKFKMLIYKDKTALIEIDTIPDNVVKNNILQSKITFEMIVNYLIKNN